MSPNAAYDPSLPDGQHRPRPNEARPWCTRTPLPESREKKPPAQPKKKRKHLPPSTPALSFDPKCSQIPSGRQDPLVSPSIHSTPSTSESSSTSSLDEQHPEVHDQYERDTMRRLRVQSESSSHPHPASYHTGYPYMDAHDANSAAPDFYDSSSSYTSSSSPAPSDQSPCAPEFPLHVIPHVYAFGNHAYAQQPTIHQDPYHTPMGSYPDRPTQGYPVSYSDVAYSRQVPHGIPAYADNSGYPYAPCKY